MSLRHRRVHLTEQCLKFSHVFTRLVKTYMLNTVIKRQVLCTYKAPNMTVYDVCCIRSYIDLCLAQL